jgi:TolB-like protein
MADIFISYAREDREAIEKLARLLEAAGLTCWWDRQLAAGARYLEKTEAELKAAKAVLVVWTRDSIGSHWVADEAGVARDAGKLAPISLDGSAPPLGFRQFQVIDFSGWTGEADDRVRDLVSALAAFAPEAEVRIVAPAPERRIAIGRRAALIAPITLAVVALLAWGGWTLMGPKPPADAPQVAQSGLAEPAATTDGGVSLAVLPFANMSADAGQEYFSDGLSEELMSQLAQIKGLRVAGRTSSFAFKDKNEDLRVIAEKLGVNHLLEGSVRKAGRRVRITAQLINAADGSQMWSQSYDRTLNDVFAIQAEIAGDVAKTLSVTLGVRENQSAAGGTTNVEAYDKYLRARALYHQRGSAEIARAIEIYREALALDPDFALAWRGLYSADLSVLVVGSSAAAQREMAQARARIQAIAPDAWWASALRTDQFLLEHRWSDAEAAARATLASAPASEVDALITYGNFLAYIGRAQEAIEYFERARDADPLSLGVSGTLQLFLDVAGRPDEAEAEFERSKDLAGDHQRWRWAAVLRSWARDNADLKAVETQYRTYIREFGSGPTSLRAILVERMHDKAAARAALRHAMADPASQTAAAMTSVYLQADLFGDKDLALSALRRAFLELDKVNFEGLWWPFKTPIRADARFKAVVREIGLVDYWRATGEWGDFCRPVGRDDFKCR